MLFTFFLERARLEPTCVIRLGRVGAALNRCVPFWLDYVYEPFTSAFMIKFIDASVINGTVRGGCEDAIEDTMSRFHAA